MKKSNFSSLLSLFFLFLVTVSCEKEDFYNTIVEDEQEMSDLKKEIEKMASQFNCDNAVEWKFVAIGTKSCGGAGAYIAYSTKVDETVFLNKVKIYSDKQKAFNVKWGSISNCALVAVPKSVECDNGKPQFVY